MAIFRAQKRRKFWSAEEKFWNSTAKKINRKENEFFKSEVIVGAYIDRKAKLRLLVSQEVFGIIRDIKPFRLTGVRNFQLLRYFDVILLMQLQSVINCLDKQRLHYCRLRLRKNCDLAV